jgi:hypothetical protein
MYNINIDKRLNNLRELSQPQERFVPKFERNQDFCLVSLMLLQAVNVSNTAWPSFTMSLYPKRSELSLDFLLAEDGTLTIQFSSDLDLKDMDKDMDIGYGGYHGELIEKY